jgi:hypothetical protein
MEMRIRTNQELQTTYEDIAIVNDIKIVGIY